MVITHLELMDYRCHKLALFEIIPNPAQYTGKYEISLLGPALNRGFTSIYRRKLKFQHHTRVLVDVAAFHGI